MSPHDDSLQGWLDGARDIRVPFALPLSDPDGSVLACEQVLRVIPGRRLVMRGQWQGQAVLAKLFVADERLPQRLQREAEGIAAVHAAGVSTPAVLAQGMSRCGRVGVLLMTWLADSRPLDAVLASDGFSAATLQAMAAVMVRLHEAGLCQRDIHPGNFLCQGGQWWVIDAGSIERCTAPLPEQASLTNLALLMAQWPLACQPRLQPLAAHYLQVRGYVSGTHGLALQVQRAWQRRTRDFLAKSLRDCTQFAVRHGSGFFASWCREDDGADLQRFLRDPDAVMGAGTILKAGNSATVVRAVMDGREVVIKRYNAKDAGRFLRRALKRSRARNAWLSGWLLAYAGVDSPKPVCLLEHRRFGLHTRAWLVTQAMAGEPLEARHIEAAPALLDAVPAVIAALAAARISHGDMKATNFLVTGSRVALIDLDATRWHHGASAASRALRRDIDRFLRNWRDRPAVQKAFAERLRPWQ